MNLRLRRIIYLSFLLLFFVSAPFLLLYASGYRIDPKKRVFEPTGILILGFSPNDATLLLNGTPPQYTRIVNETVHVSDLQPGSYRIDIAKDGYTSWSKQLNVLPNQTTFARHVILWKENKPQEEKEKNETRDAPPFDWDIITDRPSGQMFLVYRPKKQMLLDRRGEEKIPLPTSPGYRLLPSAAPLLTLLDTTYQFLYLIDPDKKESARFTEIIPNVRGAAWSPNEEKLAWWNDHDVWMIDRTTKSQTLITASRQTIQSLRWYPTSAYVFVGTGKKITAIELDDRDGRNQYDLVKKENIVDFSLNQEGSRLLLTTTEGKEKKIFALELR